MHKQFGFILDLLGSVLLGFAIAFFIMRETGFFKEVNNGILLATIGVVLGTVFSIAGYSLKNRPI